MRLRHSAGSLARARLARHMPLAAGMTLFLCFFLCLSVASPSASLGDVSAAASSPPAETAPTRTKPRRS